MKFIRKGVKRQETNENIPWKVSDNSVPSLNNGNNKTLISCSSTCGVDDDSPEDYQFKTIISLGSDNSGSEVGGYLRGCGDSSIPGYSNSERSDTLSPACSVDPICYRVVLSVGENNQLEQITKSSNSSVRIPVTVAKVDPSETSSAARTDNDEVRHFKPPLHRSDSLSVRSRPPITFSTSSLYIRSVPPPLPKRTPQRKEFLLSMIETGSNSGNSDDNDDYADPLKNEINVHEYSSSSSSGLSSSGLSSPSSPISMVRSSRQNSFLSKDSDYFGSSSEEDLPLEDDEDEEGNEEDMEENDEEEEKDDDPMDTLSPLKPLIGFPGLRKMGRFSCTQFIPKEYDLEQRIALEIKMREGTTKLLAACGAKGPQSSQPHTLEAAKSLLTSNERMTAYMAELQRRRASKRPNLGLIEPTLARVCLSDLRMPLLWKDIEHFKNKGDNRKFAVFVLLKIGTEIYDTVMVNPVDRSMTDICFDDVIVFNGISPNFECTLEVYSHLLESDMLMSSIPRKLKKTIHSSISRTVGRKLAANLRDELTSGDPGPKFEMVASATLNVKNISNNISTYDLNCSSSDNRPDELPLLGHFCCRLAAHPDCYTQERISGSAKVPESGNPEYSWCRLYGWQLEVWENKEDAETSPHHPLSLSVDRTTDIKQTSPSVLQLTNSQGVDRGILTLCFKSSEECSRWFKVLKQHVTDHERWEKAAEEEMEILTPQPSRHSFIMPKRGRFTSLYEETPLKDGSSSSAKSSTDDLSDNFSFINSYCTPAPLTPRTRAFTLSTRSSFRRWGSVRANMPFFKTKS